MILEQLAPGASIKGILPDCLVTVVQVQWFGTEALELTHEDPNGRVTKEILYRYDEPRLEIAAAGRPWSFDGDGAFFRLVSIWTPRHCFRFFVPRLTRLERRI